MNLPDFNSYIQVLLALNGAYAVYKVKIHKLIINHETLTKKESDSFSVELKLIFEYEGAALDTKLTIKHFKELETYLSTFYNYHSAYRASFIATFFYCILILLLGAFGFGFVDTLIPTAILLLFNLEVYVRSYKQLICEEEINTKAIIKYSILISLFTFIISIADIIPKEIPWLNITSACILSITCASSFLFYFLRSHTFTNDTVKIVRKIREGIEEEENATVKDDFDFFFGTPSQNLDDGAFENKAREKIKDHYNLRKENFISTKNSKITFMSVKNIIKTKKLYRKKKVMSLEEIFENIENNHNYIADADIELTVKHSELKKVIKIYSPSKTNEETDLD